MCWQIALGHMQVAQGFVAFDRAGALIPSSRRSGGVIVSQPVKVAWS